MSSQYNHYRLAKGWFWMGFIAMLLLAFSMVQSTRAQSGGSDPSDALPSYLTVIGGTESGYYDTDETVPIKADTPPEGMDFLRWWSKDDPARIGLFRETHTNTTIQIPSRPTNITIFAVAGKLEFKIPPLALDHDQQFGLLHPAPETGVAKRYPIELHLTFANFEEGDNKVDLDLFLPHLSVPFSWFPINDPDTQWHSKSVVAFWTEETDGIELQKDHMIPESMWQREDGNKFVARFWYQPKWKLSQLKSDSNPKGKLYRPSVGMRAELTVHSMASYPNSYDVRVQQKTATLLPVEIVPDYNRDGRIDDEDRARVSQENPWRWWINDDDDFGVAIGGDIPGIEDSEESSPDFNDGYVDGMRDLVDFFPLHLDIQALLELFPADTHAYELSAYGDGFGFIERADAELNTEEEDAELPGSLSRSIGLGAAIANTSVSTTSESGTALSKGFLTSAKIGKGVLLIEARDTKASRLNLLIKRDGKELARIEFPVWISKVEDMFRHIDLTNVAKNYDGTAANLREPAAATHTTDCKPAYPDELTNGKYFVFLHGFNVSGQAARGWHSEIFKRMHQMGSNARFVGVTWNGDTGLPSILPDVVTADYHKGVFHAFQTGDVLNDALAFTAGADTTVAAHSLGNMVVSHAIQDGGFRPSRYYLINGAVAKECYDPAQGTGSDERAMTERDWKNYYDAGQRRLFAANWYELFPNDARKEMRWTGRFGQVIEETDAYNFYSPGDEIVQNPSPDVDKASVLESPWRNEGFARGAWAAQEYVKGGVTLAAIGMSRDQAGWAFHYDPPHQGNPIPPFEQGYWKMDNPITQSTRKYWPDEARDEITDDDLREMPFFEPFRERDLFDETKADAKAQEKLVLYDVLARGVPAKSFAVAPNSVNGFVENINMEEEGIRTEANSWPTENHEDPKAVDRWLHSDFRDVALPYVFGMYKKMIDLADLDKPPVQP